MKKCKTCEALDFWTQSGIDYPKMPKRIFFNLTICSYTAGRMMSNENLRSSITTRKSRLKYCPECGKKLSKRDLSI